MNRVTNAFCLKKKVEEITCERNVHSSLVAVCGVCGGPGENELIDEQGIHSAAVGSYIFVLSYLVRKPVDWSVMLITVCLDELDNY